MSSPQNKMGEEISRSAVGATSYLCTCVGVKRGGRKRHCECIREASHKTYGSEMECNRDSLTLASRDECHRYNPEFECRGYFGVIELK